MITRLRTTSGFRRACAFCLSLFCLNVAMAAEVFVATDGDDRNPGTRSKPMATLEAARDRLRQLQSGARSEKVPAHLWIRGGLYSRTNTFDLDQRDSGTPSALLQISPWKNERVLIAGAVPLSAFRKISDPAMLERLSADARNHVLAANLPASFRGADLKMISRGFGRPITRSHPELFIEGKPMTLARWPNEGSWSTIAGFPAGTSQGDDHGGNIGSLPAGFFYEGDRPRTWKDVKSVWVHGYWAWDWANSYEQVDSFDLEKRLVRTAPPHGLYGFRKGQRFYFLNVLEELDAPGEWFLDQTGNQVLFWPPDSWRHGDVLLSRLETPLIRLRDASHIEISGLRLEAGRSHGVVVQGGRSNTVSSCALRLLGNYGVWIEGGEGHRVTACEIADTGDGGVSVAGGDRQSLQPGGHRVEHCHFQRQGRWSKCYVPAVLVSGVGQIIAHNLIEDHPHCAILFTGNDHQIEYNEIHHVALETGDVGAVYTGRDWTFRGNAIRFNYIHHTGGVGMGSMGAYMDDCVSGTEIRGNIFEKVSRAAFIGGGRDHMVINNLFLDCKPAVQIDGRGMDQSAVWHSMVFDYMKKQLAAVPAALYRARYPALAALDPFYAQGRGVPPEGNVVAHNICVGGDWLSIHWHAKSAEVNVVSNYAGPDPGFRDPGRKDFRFKRGAAAGNIGFAPIPADRIGPQDIPEHRRLERDVLGRR